MIINFKLNKLTQFYIAVDSSKINEIDISRDGKQIIFQTSFLGKFLVSSSDDGSLNYYDLTKGEKLNTYKLVTPKSDSYGTETPKYSSR